ncbi:hypothetical protein K525DRAFT_275696 [Schizophyllum commune Loenen D]|nr:hypothetical protein K525DRAFT_275696 [Schizophyllum commune Loenen D]
MAGAFAREVQAERLVLNHVGGRFPFPAESTTDWKARIMREFERQATDAWVGDDAARRKTGRRAIVAADFMRVEVCPEWGRFNPQGNGAGTAANSDGREVIDVDMDDTLGAGSHPNGNASTSQAHAIPIPIPFEGGLNSGPILANGDLPSRPAFANGASTSLPPPTLLPNTTPQAPLGSRIPPAPPARYGQSEVALSARHVNGRGGGGRDGGGGRGGDSRRRGGGDDGHNARQRGDGDRTGDSSRGGREWHSVLGEQGGDGGRGYHTSRHGESQHSRHRGDTPARRGDPYPPRGNGQRGADEPGRRRR